MLWIGLHKWANVIFGITQKPLCIKWSKLPRWYINKKGFSKNVLQPKERLLTSLTIFLFVILPTKRDWVQRKNQVSFLKVFLIILFQYVSFSKGLFVYISCFGLLTKIEKGSGTQALKSDLPVHKSI